tara:strand:+ start:2206 stop:2844 length:639 start_codon:yes stop_codon:yes gene_type:complete
MHLAPKPSFRGWSHITAFFAAIALCPILISSSVHGRVLAAFYSLAVVALFGVSSLYHGFSWNARAHDLLRRLDHATIFVTIAATYTPISWYLLPRSAAVTVLLAVWIGALLGVLVMIFWPTAPQTTLITLFIIVGWSALMVIHEFWVALSTLGFTLLLLGGVFHTIGAIVYGIKKPDPWPTVFGFHEVFHFCVICGIASHYVLVAFIALPDA